MKLSQIIDNPILTKTHNIRNAMQYLLWHIEGAASDPMQTREAYKTIIQTLKEIDELVVT